MRNANANAHAQLSLAPPIDMDLDDTTFLTGVTRQSPDRSPGRASIASIQIPGGVRLPPVQTGEADDDEQSNSGVPSPSFSGFHSAQSSPGARISSRFNEEESVLDGHTLIDEQQSMLGHTLIGEPSILGESNQDCSALSFLSASVNQSTADIPNRQVVDGPLHNQSGGSNHSLLSIVHAPENEGENENENENEGPAGAEPVAGTGPRADGPSDRYSADFDFLAADEDSLLHSEQSLHLSPQHSPQPLPLPLSLPIPSPSQSTSRSASRSRAHSSKKAPTSAQPEESNSSPDSNPKHSLTPTPPSPQISHSQLSDFIDLTQDSSPARSAQADPEPEAEPGWVSKPDTGDNTLPRPRRTRASSRVQVQLPEGNGNVARRKGKKKAGRRF